MSEENANFFIDNTGEKWKLVHTVGDTFALRDDLGVDVGKLVSKETDSELEKLLNDPTLIARILAWTCDKQIQEKGITERDFYYRLEGDIVDRALVPWLNAVAESLPKLQRRAMKALIAKMDRSIEIAAAGVEKKIQEKDHEKEIQKRVDQIPV